MQMQGNGSNTAQHFPQRICHPHCLGWSVCGLCSPWGVVAGSLLQCIPYCLGGYFAVQFPQQGTLSMCPWATGANQSNGDNCYKALLILRGMVWETHTQKVKGQFVYGTENLLTKVVFAAPALLTHLWQVTLFPSSLSVLWEWSPWLLPISVSWWGQRAPLLLCSPPVCTDALSGEELWERTRCSFLTLENDC